jgi:hypothetical protein
MNRQPWTLEHRRYVVALRTMLAHPAGSNPCNQIPQVLDEITEVYPDVWSPNAHSRKPGVAFNLRRTFLRALNYSPRCPLRVYRVLVKLGRQEITEHEATVSILRQYRK